MDIDDKELFSSAMTDEPISDVADTPAEAPVTETPQPAERAGDDRPRDEHGRFAAKQTEPEAPQPPPPAEQGQADDDVRIPPWRLREMREERDTFSQRYQEAQRQIEMLQRQMPKPEPKPAPDMFESPDGFVDHRMDQRMTPYEQQQQALRVEVQEQREFMSRYFAENKYGAEKVHAAYNWLGQGIKANDPLVVHVYNQVMQSKHPYDAAVQAYDELSLMQQVKAAGGPDKWREQQLAAGQSQPTASQERAGRQQSNGQPQGSVTRLPPSLRNTPSARTAGGDDDPNDMSDAALFRHAMR
jgi:hypothetical protein